jgi:hypothetical protein
MRFRRKKQSDEKRSSKRELDDLDLAMWRESLRLDYERQRKRGAAGRV